MAAKSAVDVATAEMEKLALWNTQRVATVQNDLALLEKDMRIPILNYFTSLNLRYAPERVKELYKECKKAFAHVGNNLLLDYVPELGPVLHEASRMSKVIKDLPYQLANLSRARQALYSDVEFTIDDPLNNNTTEKQRRYFIQVVFKKQNLRLYEKGVDYYHHMRLVAERALNQLTNGVFDSALQRARYLQASNGLSSVDATSMAIEYLIEESRLTLMFVTLHVIQDPHGEFDGLFDRIIWGKHGNGPEGWEREEPQDEEMGERDGKTTPPPAAVSREPPPTNRKRLNTSRLSNRGERQQRRALNFDNL